MKKIMLMVLALVLMLALASTASAIDTYYVKTNGSSLRVRLEPWSDSEIIGHLSYGAQVGVESISGGWAQIVYGSYGSAYVSSRYLTRTNPGSAPKKNTDNTGASSQSSTSGKFDLVSSYNNFEPKYYAVEVHPSNTFCNLRWGPNTSAGIMSIRHEGDILIVIAENREWCQVYDSSTNECGFIQAKFLLPIMNDGNDEG